MKCKIFIFIIFIIFLLLSNSISFAGVKKKSSDKVIGLNTYEYCCSECRKKTLSIPIPMNCLEDPNCSNCVDMCGQELKENNDEEYEQMLRNTIVKEIF